MACKDCLNRREFLAKSTVGAAAAAALVAIEGCGDGQIGPSAVSQPTVPTNGLSVKIADYPTLASNNVLVQLNGADIGVVRTGATTFVASSMVCTHEGCETSVRNNQFSCPCHDSLFSATGAVLRGPATRNLDGFATSFDATTGTLRIG